MIMFFFALQTKRFSPSTSPWDGTRIQLKDLGQARFFLAILTCTDRWRRNIPIYTCFDWAFGTFFFLRACVCPCMCVCMCVHACVCSCGYVFMHGCGYLMCLCIYNVGIYTCPWIDTYIATILDTWQDSRTAYLHMYMHTHMYTNITLPPLHIHAYIHTYTYTQIAQIYENPLYLLLGIHTYTHTYTHTYIHTHRSHKYMRIHCTCCSTHLRLLVPENFRYVLVINVMYVRIHNACMYAYIMHVCTHT